VQTDSIIDRYCDGSMLVMKSRLSSTMVILVPMTQCSIIRSNEWIPDDFKSPSRASSPPSGPRAPAPWAPPWAGLHGLGSRGGGQVSGVSIVMRGGGGGPRAGLQRVNRRRRVGPGVGGGPRARTLTMAIDP